MKFMDILAAVNEDVPVPGAPVSEGLLAIAYVCGACAVPGNASPEFDDFVRYVFVIVVGKGGGFHSPSLPQAVYEEGSRGPALSRHAGESLLAVTLRLHL